MALIFDNFYYPFGKGSAVGSANKQIENFKETYFKLVKDIHITCVYDKFKESYIFFGRVPSEKNEEYNTPVYFDVVLEFTAPKQNKKDFIASPSIRDYEICLFSNSPSFMYTFTYVANKRGHLPKCLPKSLCSKIALTKAPKVRNPIEIMTLEKTTWMIFFHIDHNHMTDKNYLKTVFSNKPAYHFIRQIKSQEAKKKEIDIVQKELSEEKKILKQQNNASKQIEKDYKTSTTLKANMSVNMKTDMKSNMKHNMKTNSLKANLKRK